MNKEPTTQTKDSTTEMAECIGQAIVEARDRLLAERDAQIAAANAPLDGERESLLEEYGAIVEAAQNLEALLPAKAREAQRQADVFLLAGKREEAQAKIAEQREAEAAPATMKARQQAISARLEALEEQKREIARHVFLDWYTNLQTTIRSCEHGLFIDLLDSGLGEMRAYQERHGLTGTLADPYGFLVKDSHIQNLTADERSDEWRGGNKWYAGRR